MVLLIYSLLFGITLVSALLVVFSRHAVYSALYLVSSMISMAGIFILINAQLAAVLQVLVYAGAIMVLFIFVIMLLNIRFFEEPPLETRFVRRIGAVAFVVFLIQAVILMIRFGAVEFGSGDGTLARDVVRYVQQFDEAFAAALRYTEYDRADPDSEDAGDARDAGATPTGVTGCVLSNELLDAFPVHRFVIENGSLLELYVAAGDNGLFETPGPVSDPEIERRVAPFVSDLPDGYRGEVNLGLRSWAERIATTLERGFILTIDYGEAARELYRPGRSEGSLRAYYRHTLSQNPFQHIGDQDLTAHVDFSAVDSELSRVGIEALGITTQTAFLDRLGLRAFLGNLPSLGLPAGEVERNRVPMLWLARPDGLGRFKVAFHARGVDARPPIGLDSRRSGYDPSNLPTPLLEREDGHFDLAGGAYPAGTSEFTATWAELLGEDEENDE